MPVLKRQFISDAAGNPIGVILPLEEYRLVADTLEQQLTAQLDDKLRQMEQAAHDPLFTSDLEETLPRAAGRIPTDTASHSLAVSDHACAT